MTSSVSVDHEGWLSANLTSCLATYDNATPIHSPFPFAQERAKEGDRLLGVTKIKIK